MSQESKCPRCGSPAISTARQDDICQNSNCDYRGYYYRDAYSSFDTSNEGGTEISKRNDNVEKGGSYNDNI